jgi:uncharacterized metal-binding protein
MSEKTGTSCGCKCNCSSKVNIIYSCSGASNVGQLSNEIALIISESGKASMGCLIGVGAEISTMVMNAKSADSVIVIDGCPQCCGKKMLEKAEISNVKSFVITEMGVKKTGDLRGDRDMSDKLAKIIVNNI